MMLGEYALVVRDGTIFDGSGADPFDADVAIKDGRIAAVGKLAGRGREEIDAAGHLVTPGFVDVHTQYDGQITWENRLMPSSNHGVTTVVMGNCGVGFAPVRDHQRDMAIKLMEGVEDIPEVVMAAGVPFNWETFPEYLDAIEERHADVDFAAQLPHSPLRVYVMGQRGADLEAPTDAELADMTRITAQAVGAKAPSACPPRSTRSIAFATGAPRPRPEPPRARYWPWHRACAKPVQACSNCSATATSPRKTNLRCCARSPPPLAGRSRLHSANRRWRQAAGYLQN